MGSLAIAWELQKAAFRGQLSYRVNFLVLTLMGIAYQGSGFAFIWVLMHQFDSIGGWSTSEVAFLYALRLLAHSAWVVPFNQVEFLDSTVREGRFDRYLVRPLNPLLQVMTNRFQMNVIGDLATAVIFFAATAVVADVSFTPLHVVYLILAVIGGGLAEGALVLAVSSLSFRFLQVWAAQHLIDNVYLMFGSYPMHIFGRAASWVLTWTIPVAFVAYVPSGLLIDKTSGLHLSRSLAWCAPVVGLVWFLAAYRIWVRQMRRYEGTGS
jgi:ABC-2 type transport system permease protein